MILPFVIECMSREKCPYYEGCLGLECPEVVREAREYLRTTLGYA